jgi:hypothetical protein
LTTADGAKAEIRRQITDEGFSESYALLIHLLALVGFDPVALEPESDEELAEWRGHLTGLRAALFCLVMHERRIGPESAALVVKLHVEKATTILGGPNGGGGLCPTG